MPKVNVLKPFQPSHIQAELESVRQCELELTAADNEVKAIRARIAESAQAEQVARAQLAQAQASARTPADMATMDAELARAEEAERAIQAAERQRGPLRHLLENAERQARVHLETLRDARRALFQAEFENRRVALKSELPALETLLGAFGCWWQGGGNAPDGQLWAAFLRDLIGPQPREALERYYHAAPALVGLASTASE